MAVYADFDSAPLKRNKLIISRFSGYSQLVQWISVHLEGKGAQLVAVLVGEHCRSWNIRISD